MDGIPVFVGGLVCKVIAEFVDIGVAWVFAAFNMAFLVLESGCVFVRVVEEVLKVPASDDTFAIEADGGAIRVEECFTWLTRLSCP